MIRTLSTTLALASIGSLAYGSGVASPQASARSLARLTPTFEQNTGRYGKSVRFVSRLGGGATLFITDREAVVVTRSGGSEAPSERRIGPRERSAAADARMSAVTMRLEGSKGAPTVAGMDRRPGVVNYLIGNDRSKWRRNVPTFGRIRMAGVYPGVDLVYYQQSDPATGRHALEYDFVVKPGADASRVRLAFDGADRMRLAGGDLVLTSAGGDLRLRRPYAYQQIGGRRVQVACKYRVAPGAKRVAFQVARYDMARPLVVDPVLEYSTYLGGSDEDRTGHIAVDVAGCAYIGAHTWSMDMPTTGAAYQAAFRGGPYTSYIAKLNPTGSGLVYATYLGGDGYSGDGCNGIAVDGAGCAYVAGYTHSSSFPTTLGAFQRVNRGHYDGYVAKLNATGSDLIYSTLLGGSYDYDMCKGIALDTAGYAYITGMAGSADFPITAGALQTSFNGGGEDGFVAKLSRDGGSLIYSTFLGGTGWDECDGITINGAGNAYVTGYTSSSDFPTTPGSLKQTGPGGTHDGFVVKLAASGAAAEYATYFGGSKIDMAYKIVIDDTGAAYIVGTTESADLPVTSAAFQRLFGGGGCDAFVAKLNASGTGLIYCTYIGGSGWDYANDILLDSLGAACLVGQTYSQNFPINAEALQPNLAGESDTFVARLTASGRDLAYSTFFGGTAGDDSYGIALDGVGAVYITGRTFSSDLPVPPGAFQSSYKGGVSDGFIAKMRLVGDTATSVFVPDRAVSVDSPVGLKGYLSRTVERTSVSGRHLEFSVAGTDIGCSSTGADGAAELSWAVDGVTGTRAIRVDFAGDGVYLPSSGTGALTVSVPTKLYVVDRTWVGGTTVPLKAYLYRKSDSLPLMDETLRFLIDGSLVGTAKTGTGGEAQRDWFIVPGAATRVIRVDFAGDGTYGPCTGTGKLTVITYNTTLSATDRGGEILEPIVMKGYLYRTPGSAPVVGKILTFSVDSTTIGSATTNSSGRALITWTVPDSLAPGAHAYTVAWAGDAGYNPSSASPSLVISKGVSYLWLASRSVKKGTAAYIRAYLRRLPDYAWMPARTVTFALDGTPLGQGTTDASGMAAYLYNCPAGAVTGDHPMSAEFPGDDRYLPSGSEAILTVTL